MKKRLRLIKAELFAIISVTFFLCSCTDGSGYSLPELSVAIDRQKVAVGETVTIEILYDEITVNAIKNFIIYIENYPDSYNVTTGSPLDYQWLPEPEKYLCIRPEHCDGDTKYKAEVQLKFDTPGEHTIKINGCNYIDFKAQWKEDLYTYKFDVRQKEEDL